MMILLDATDTSLTVSWTPIPNAKRYILQYRENNNESSSSSFVTLSTKLSSTQARKRNLHQDDDEEEEEEGKKKGGFFFRVAAIDTDFQEEEEEEEVDTEKLQWTTHVKPFHLLTTRQETNKMEAPIVTPNGYQAALLSWKKKKKETKEEEEVKGYELQMRENNGGKEWNTVASCLSNTQVRKKNLMNHQFGYQFRIRPVYSSTSNEKEEVPFSSPSLVFTPPNLSPGIRQFFSRLETPMCLLQKNPGGAKKISLEDALVGKEFILIYVSAHWCPPCRQYTPQLVQFYNTIGRTQSLEIIFCSADHDENGFQSYYSTMPWLAIDYDDDGREGIMSQIRVSGIPRLVVLDGKSGRVLEENAVGKALDVGLWRRLANNGSSS